MKRVLTSFLAAGLISFSGLAQQDLAFQDVYQIIYHNNPFKARDVYSTTKDNLSLVHQKFIEAFLDNAFGRLTESNEKITELQNKLDQFPDSLQVALYTMKVENSLKLFEYKEAKIAIEHILENYEDVLTKKAADEYRNGLTIFTAIENQPKQQITINGDQKIKLKKDIFRMKKFTVKMDNDSFDFILDSGAALSVVSRSVAEKFKMNIIPVSIEALGSNAVTVFTQIAVCPVFYLGNIKIENAVFLVIDDKDLTFGKLFFKYRVLGIIGLPIYAAFNELQMTKDGYFLVPEKETVYEGSSNMARFNLTNLISIEGNPYIFDTGSDVSSFFKPYYLANRDEIENKYKLKTIRFSSVGGSVKEKGYEIDVKLNVQGRDITLKKVHLSREDFIDMKGLWGLIGQDLIGQFEKVTLNFNQMFIKFE